MGARSGRVGVPQISQLAMSDLQKAAQAVLTAWHAPFRDGLFAAMDRLRAALAAPQPEPVAGNSERYCVDCCKELEPHQEKLCESCQSQRLAHSDLLTAPPQPEPQPEPVAWQGGMTNEELLREWRMRLPTVEPTDRELSAFALGIETSHKIVWVPAPQAEPVGEWRLVPAEPTREMIAEMVATAGNPMGTQVLAREMRAAYAAMLAAAPQSEPNIDLMLDVLLSFAVYDAPQDRYIFDSADMRAALEAAMGVKK